MADDKVDEISLEGFHSSETEELDHHPQKDSDVDDNDAEEELEEVKKAIQENDDEVCDTVRQWLSKNPQRVNVGDSENNKTALHYAAEHRNVQVTAILLQAGADPNRVDENKQTALHCLCDQPKGKNSAAVATIKEVGDLLLNEITDIDVQDYDECTALHYAARNHHNTVAVRLLGDKGADMTLPDGIGDTSVHMAAESGNHELLAVMMKKAPECVHLEGYNEETLLHQAVQGGHLETVKLILSSKTLDPAKINARSRADETPLHFLAVDGSLEIGKLLVKHGALVNPPTATRYTKTPFHKAAFYGQTDLALYLLEEGARVTAWAFQDILSEQYVDIAKAVITSDQWPLALRGMYKRRGKYTTAFRELIVKMPDVAKMVLDHCTVQDDSKVQDDRDYNVLYNYEFIEDYNEESESHSMLSTEPDDDDLGRKGKGKRTYGCGYNDVINRESSPTWGPSKFLKAEHPLQIMVRENALDLLEHPVVASLLHFKWMKFGLIGYIANLLTYVVFLCFLTAFALVVPNPQSPACTGGNTTSSNTNTGSTNQEFVITSSIIVLLMSISRLLFELAQFGLQRLSYITDLVNWVECIQYICSIIFVVVYAMDSFCVMDWQWQVGVVAVFLGWINLILFVSKLPFVGIYVIILISISKTFARMLIVTILLIVAFGITFFMIFYDPEATRSPFSDVPRSFLKTMTMTTGEFEYDSIFRLDPAGESDVPEIKYPPISYILWIVFLIVMPVILINMLISLAVGDTHDVKKNAGLKKLALQVDQVLSMEELLVFLKKCLPKRWKRTKPFHQVYPNHHQGRMYEASFRLWEGTRYDRSDVILRVIRPPKNLNEVLEKTEAMTGEIKNIHNILHEVQEEVKKSSTMAEDIKAMKQKLDNLDVQSLLKEIRNSMDTQAKHDTV